MEPHPIEADVHLGVAAGARAAALSTAVSGELALPPGEAEGRVLAEAVVAPLESFVPGRNGTVIPEKPTTWTVVGTDGSWVADVVLPARFSLLDAGRDYVAGVELDEDDVESVVVYRLKR